MRCQVPCPGAPGGLYPGWTSVAGLLATLVGGWSGQGAPSCSLPAPQAHLHCLSSQRPSPCLQLAANADIFVNDAFGTAHRAHASTEGVTKYLKPSVAGAHATAGSLLAVRPPCLYLLQLFRCLKAISNWQQWGRQLAQLALRQTGGSAALLGF